MYYVSGLLNHIIEAIIFKSWVSDTNAHGSLNVSTDSSCAVPQPVPFEVALAHMPILQKLEFWGCGPLPPSLACHLTSLTCLEVEEDSLSHEDLAALGRARSLKSLVLRPRCGVEPETHSMRGAPEVCSLTFSHLRSLRMCVEVEDVPHLSALTSLTKLILSLECNGEVRLEPLAALTGLRELRLTKHSDKYQGQFAASGSFLGALTCLTRLKLCNADELLGGASELLGLTALPRLRVLTLRPLTRLPSYQEGRLLPLELAFLGTATALRNLQCTINSQYFDALSPISPRGSPGGHAPPLPPHSSGDGRPLR